MTQSLSEFLKENTKQLHDDTEAKFDSQRIFDRTYSLDDYKKILRLNYLFHNDFEDKAIRALSPETSEKLNAESRRKLPAFEKDLQHLNLDKAEINESISVNSEAEALGILYVMEGSTLGGNVIAKQLSRNPAFENTEFNYYGVYGEKTGENWKNFKETLDSRFSEEQYEEVLKGTKKAYQYMLESE